MIKFRGKGVHIGELWFAEPDQHGSSADGVDIVVYNQAPRPHRAGEMRNFETLLLDLTKSEAELASGIVKGTLYEIRRADRDDALALDFQGSPGHEELEEFRRFFEIFAEKKGLGAFGPNRLAAHAQSGQLCVSFAREKPGGPVLCAHAYVTGLGRARLLYSASVRIDADPSLRARAGRANRWLHWRDILAFRERGFLTYDMGGWDPKPATKELAGINKFKEGFSTRKEKSFNGSFAVTLRGRAYLFAKAAMRKLGR